MVAKSSELVEKIKAIPDPRRQCKNLKHKLEDIIVLGFCGVLAGCDDFVEIELWTNHNSEFFHSFLELPNGIPSHDTFNRVFSMLRPTALQEVLVPWILERRGLPGDLIHLDGKTMCNTRCKAKGLGALHVVSAWAGQTGITLGQVAVDAKSNEITAMPQVLEMLDLREKIVTIDAMGCQKDIATQIVEKEGDYVITVKDNQPTLHEEIQTAFAKEEANPKSPPNRTHMTTETGHGRHEIRKISVLPAKGNLSEELLNAWTGLITLVMVIRVVTNLSTKETSTEVSYYISSHRTNAKAMSRAIRSHWSIENSLHWVLDVVFREDARRLYNRTAAENISLLNRIAVSVLRGDTSKGSMKVKRKRNGWGTKYLAELLGI